MWFFVTHEKHRHLFFVEEDKTVKDFVADVRATLRIGDDQAPQGIDGCTRQVLRLQHAGAILEYDWPVADIGIPSGSTLTVSVTEEVEPSITISCMYNEETIPILDNLRVSQLPVSELRAITVRKTGLPIGSFRLVSSCGLEMFDGHTLSYYDVEVGDTVLVQVWDGMRDLINAAVVGQKAKALSCLDTNEVLCRYQMKVALHICAHFGHVNLATHLLRNGIKPDEPIGEHPTRLWCREQNTHVDRLRCPVHVAAEMGHLAVFRAFVQADSCCIFTADGNGLRPLNIALRKKQKDVTSFLLKKQWSTVPFGSTKETLPLYIYAKLKKWGDRAKEKATTKSSLKNARKYVPNIPLVGMGVNINGGQTEPMTSKPLARMKEEKRSNRPHRRFSSTVHPENRMKGLEQTDPEVYFTERCDSMNGEIGNLRSGWLRRTPKHSFMRTGSKQTFDLRKISQHTRPESIAEETLSRTYTGSCLKHPPGDITRLPALKREISVISTNRKSVPSPDMRRKPLPALCHSVCRDGNDKEGKQNMNDADDSSTFTNQSLPIISTTKGPKRLAKRLRDSDVSAIVLSEYEDYRGLPASEYASKCMSLANRFKNKPWLYQMRQASTIATNGVRRTVAGERHIFHSSS